MPKSFVNITSRTYALGAIHDARKGNMAAPCVRVLLVARFTQRFQCRFTSGAIVDGGKLYEMSENHAMAYGVYFLNCPVPDDEIVGDTVEVRCSFIARVPVIYNISKLVEAERYIYELTICLPFLFGRRYSGATLVEVFLMFRISLFVYLLHPRCCFIFSQHMALHTIRKLSRLRLPVDFKKIWHHGQLVAITDCLYRGMGVSRFVAFHDLDEFLIPQVSRSSTLNALFEENVASIPPSYVQISAKQTDCVVRPEMIFEQGIHHTSRVIQDHYVSPLVSNDILRLYHYKVSDGSKTDDTILENYGKLLRQRFEDVVERIGLYRSP
ncbi:unnamed protein product [Heligmosomoides polygyrus]|uniref:Glycosyltransferase family 92 protein n=1 Tax=Heligmosomoides polygyrus TaxID=6339 RepID=A0A3P8ASK9_HELPZ|nr:unnamed protein product [Heligmosomoides polygyrus]